jgi:hypothetical protein
MQSNRNSQATSKEMFSNFSIIASPSPFVIASTCKVRGNPWNYFGANAFLFKVMLGLT